MLAEHRIIWIVLKEHLLMTPGAMDMEVAPVRIQDLFVIAILMTAVTMMATMMTTIVTTIMMTIDVM